MAGVSTATVQVNVQTKRIYPPWPQPLGTTSSQPNQEPTSALKGLLAGFIHEHSQPLYFQVLAAFPQTCCSFEPLFLLAISLFWAMIHHALGLPMPPWPPSAAWAGTGTSFTLRLTPALCQHPSGLALQWYSSSYPSSCGSTGGDEHMDGKRDTIHYLWTSGHFWSFSWWGIQSTWSCWQCQPNVAMPLFSLQACPWVMLKFLKGMVSLYYPPTLISIPDPYSSVRTWWTGIPQYQTPAEGAGLTSGAESRKNYIMVFCAKHHRDSEKPLYTSQVNQYEFW